MLEEKLAQIHAEAHSLSFGWYLRTGMQHHRLKQMMQDAHSLQSFIVPGGHLKVSHVWPGQSVPAREAIG